MALVKAYVNNKDLIIEIHPQEGWGIPNQASLVEMEGLKMKPVLVGEIKLGYDEDISVEKDNINIFYLYEGPVGVITHVVTTESEEIGFLKPIIWDLMGLSIPLPVPIGTIEYLFDPSFTDLSTRPESDFFTDDNEYDQCVILWPDQSVKFSGDVIGKEYVNHPNYVYVQVPLVFEEDENHESFIHIYVRLLYDAIWLDILGHIKGHEAFTYASTEFSILL